MSTPRANGPTPDWVIAEMPPGYQNRVAEIQRLSDELRDLERFGRLLWCVGENLTDAVRSTFAAFGFEAEPPPGSPGTSLTVKLDGGRRLLLAVSPADGVVQKKSQAVADAFQLVREIAGGADRVALVANSDPDVQPADRREAASPDALDLLSRLGVNLVAGQTVFALWRLSLQDRDRARAYAVRLHEQDGGAFVLPSTAPR